MRATVLVILLAACGGKADEATCEEVADHMLDLMTLPAIDAGVNVPAPSAAAAKAEEDRKKKFRAGASARAHLVAKCTEGMSEAKARCILAAQSEKALAACGQ